MKTKINTALVQGLQPRGQPYEVFDRDLKGFIVRVQPSGSISFLCAYRTKIGQRRRYTIGRAGVITPAQARDEAKKILGDVARGLDPVADQEARRAQAKQHTLKSFLQEVYEPWTAQHLDTGTETLQRLKVCFKDFLDRRLADLNPWLFEKWKSERLKSGTRATTVNRDLGALKAALARAVDWGHLEGHPLLKVKPAPVKDNGITRWLSESEETELRATLEAREDRIRRERASANAWRRERGYPELPDLTAHEVVDHLRPMVLVSMNTGLRRGELFGLEWSDIDWENAVITVRGTTSKSKKSRHVPMNDEVVAKLRAWQKFTGRRDGLVFPGREGNETDNVKRSWAAVLKAAKIETFRWHDMRHHFASRLVMEGVDLNTVRELLGHADLKMTLRYAHLAPEHKAAAVAKLLRAA
ncbi:MAG: site-specific integrase [Burkholderiales bacterium]|nr:site-specific integrase [Burkholderiales bacterium]